VNGFPSVIELYRAAERPEVIDNRFSYEGDGSDRLRGALASCEQLDARFGRFEDDPHWVNGHVDFSWVLGSNDFGAFYLSVEDFISRCESLHRGVVPDNFYVASLDYLFTAQSLSDDSTNDDPDHFLHSPSEIQKIHSLCRLIRLLGNLSLAGSLVAEAGRASHLVFVKPASAGVAPTTVEIVTWIEPSMLSYNTPNLKVLTDLLGKGESGRVRNEEYRAVFRLAIATVGAEEVAASSRFAWLVQKWDRVLARFSYDVECLVDRLSFEGLKREILDAELTFVGRVSTSVVDNATKFLGIPLSLVALAAVLSSDSISSDVVVCLGALLVSLVVGGVARAVGYQLDSTASAFDGVLQSLRMRANEVGEVAGTIKQLETTFLDRLTFARRAVATFHVLAWIPPCIGTALIAWKFPPGWFGSVGAVLARWLGY